MQNKSTSEISEKNNLGVGLIIDCCVRSAKLKFCRSHNLAADVSVVPKHFFFVFIVQMMNVL